MATVTKGRGEKAQCVLSKNVFNMRRNHAQHAVYASNHMLQCHMLQYHKVL